MIAVRAFLLILPLLLFHLAARGEEEDNKVQDIKKIDLSQPDQASGPGHSIIIFDLKNLKVPGAHAHVVFNQLRKRVRIEFEATALPKGKYVIALDKNCSAHDFKRGWKELHHFTSESMHVATEKAHYELTLAGLQGQAVGLFKAGGGKTTFIDCKPIR
jgi:hypothetical protein